MRGIKKDDFSGSSASILILIFVHHESENVVGE